MTRDVRLVLIEWIDSHSEDGWQPLDEIETEPYRCRSVGWLVHESADVKIIAATLGMDRTGADAESSCVRLSIPTVAVCRVVPLAESGSRVKRRK